MSDTKSGYISASQISNFLFCPLAYKYIYVDGAERMPGSLYTAYGSAIHGTLEHNYRQKITSRTDISTQEAQLKFAELFKEEVEKLPSLGGYGDPETLMLQGQEMVYKYMKEMAPTIQPIAVEEKFEIKLESCGVTIFGFIDLITEDPYIIDHKTAGASTEAKRTQASVDRNYQLTMYSLAYRKMFNKPEKGVRIDVLKRLKSGPAFDSITTTRSDLDVVVLIQLLARMQQMTHDDIWYPNLDKCSECQFKNSCSKLGYAGLK